MIGTVRFQGRGDGPGEEVVAHQRFVDNEPYRAARRGTLIVDKFASRRRFEGWGTWAQDRIRVSDPLSTFRNQHCAIRDPAHLPQSPTPLGRTQPHFWTRVDIFCFPPRLLILLQAVTVSKFFEQVCVDSVRLCMPV